MPFIAEIALLMIVFILLGIVLVAGISLLVFVISQTLSYAKKRKEKGKGEGTPQESP